MRRRLVPGDTIAPRTKLGWRASSDTIQSFNDSLNGLVGQILPNLPPNLANHERLNLGIDLENISLPHFLVATFGGHCACVALGFEDIGVQLPKELKKVWGRGNSNSRSATACVESLFRSGSQNRLQRLNRREAVGGHAEFFKMKSLHETKHPSRFQSKINDSPISKPKFW